MTAQLSDIQAGSIDKFEITSNDSSRGSKDLSAGVSEFRYYESILSNYITATAVISETGHESDGDNTVSGEGTVDGLPIRGGERTDIIIRDDYNNILSFRNGLYVNRVRNSDPNVQKDVYFLDFASKESFLNEETRVTRRYDGKVSSHVENILTQVLQTNSLIDIDETAGKYNFIGNTKKPFTVCTWLASKAVPQVTPGGGTSGSGLGGAAGYFFYQTRNSFHFKSIDKLFQGDPKRKYIYNTGKSVRGYDANIIKYTIDRDVDLKESLVLGTYNNTTLFFDTFSFNYVHRNYDIDDQKTKIDSAGRNFAPEGVADEFKAHPSRLMTSILDNGILPEGTNSTAQLAKWKSEPKTPNYDAPNAMVQSVMRYNQLFTIQIQVIIPGDFTIKAGDLVECAFPKLEGSPTKEINRQSSGIYMVAHVCHRITSSDTLTSLSLIRDSYR